MKETGKPQVHIFFNREGQRFIYINNLLLKSESINIPNLLTAIENDTVTISSVPVHSDNPITIVGKYSDIPLSIKEGRIE